MNDRSEQVSLARTRRHLHHDIGGLLPDGPETTQHFLLVGMQAGNGRSQRAFHNRYTGYHDPGLSCQMKK
jgi:hypothetical protein